MKKITFSFKKFIYIYLFSNVYFSELTFAATTPEDDKWSSWWNILFDALSKDLFVNVFIACIVVIITFFLAKFLSSKLTNILEASYSWKEEWREELVWVLTRTINIIILSIWFAITLTVLWIDMWIFLWWLWFGIGFTLKIFLTNFIGWVLMVTQWFYHIWDVVKVWSKTWSIKNIHALFTSIEQFDWVIFYVPNVKFLEEEIINYHTNDKRRVDINIWVDYKTDLVKAKEIMLNVTEKFPNILKWPEADIILSEMKDSSIELSLRFWINSKDSYFEIKSNVTETINLLFKQEWIDIPFPQITISNRLENK